MGANHSALALLSKHWWERSMLFILLEEREKAAQAKYVYVLFVCNYINIIDNRLKFLMCIETPPSSDHWVKLQDTFSVFALMNGGIYLSH